MSKRYILSAITFIMFFLNSCIAIRAQNNDCNFFYEGITKNPLYRNYMITVNAEYKGEKIRILTDKNELVSLLEEAKQPYGDDAIIALLKGEGYVKLPDTHIFYNATIKPVERIDKILKRGKEYTLKTYFNKLGGSKLGSLENELEVNYLLDALSKWCVLVFKDDETGYYGLEKKEGSEKYFESLKGKSK